MDQNVRAFQIFISTSIRDINRNRALPDENTFEAAKMGLYTHVNNILDVPERQKININEFNVNEDNEISMDGQMIDDIYSIFSFIENINYQNLNIDNDTFIENFYKVIKVYLYAYGLNIMNMTPLVRLIVDRINSRTRRPRYAILNCRDNLGSYTCGRAVSFTIDPTKTTKIILFNTVSEFDDFEDSEYQQTLVNTTFEHGQRDVNFYYKKYLKYKSKYIEMKKKLNK